MQRLPASCQQADQYLSSCSVSAIKSHEFHLSSSKDVAGTIRATVLQLSLLSQLPQTKNRELSNNSTLISSHTLFSSLLRTALLVCAHFTSSSQCPTDNCFCHLCFPVFSTSCTSQNDFFCFCKFNFAADFNWSAVSM